MSRRGTGGAHDDEVAVHDTGSHVADGNRVRVPAEPLTQVDAAITAEAGDQLPVTCIDGEQVSARREQDALVVSCAPVANAAQTLPGFHRTAF